MIKQNFSNGKNKSPQIFDVIIKGEAADDSIETKVYAKFRGNIPLEQKKFIHVKIKISQNICGGIFCLNFAHKRNVHALSAANISISASFR